MKPKIFLTGSTGYVGTKFIEMYGSQFDIFGVSRTNKKHPIDLLDFESLKNLFSDYNPDYILHLAADVGRDITTSAEIAVTSPAIMKNLVELALKNNTPFLFTSTEAVYGGKWQEGEYTETDKYEPRSPYGVSKVMCEELLMTSGLPYLITRGHRHVGISKNFSRTKQFPDALRQIINSQVIHLDSHKPFTPVLINNACDIFAHYITNDSDKQVLINIGVNRAITFYEFMNDVAQTLGLGNNLVKPDGDEAGWPPNSTLSVRKLHELNYPVVTYEQMLKTIKTDAA